MLVFSHRLAPQRPFAFTDNNAGPCPLRDLLAARSQPRTDSGDRRWSDRFLVIRKGVQMTVSCCLFLDSPAKADPPRTSRTDTSATIAPYRSGKPTSYTNSKSCAPEAN